MSSEFDEPTFEEIKAPTKSAFSMGPFGSRIKAENFVSEGVPVIKGGNLNGDLDSSSFDFLTPEKAAELSTSIARRLDLVITHRGTLGQVGIIPPNSRYPEYIVSQSQLKLSFDQAKVNPYFIYYFLRSSVGQRRLLANTSQVGVPAIAQALTSIRNIRVPLPSLKEQDSIVCALRLLDDRIALLRETNATLEAIAQAMFKSWFVDFDPVHAKQQGCTPEGMSETTAALFPDSFEESEQGLVPRGWKVEPLTEVFDFREGPGIRNWQYTNSDQGTRFINIRCIQDGDLSIETASRITDEEANGKYAHFHLKAWDVVVSTSGTLGRSAIVRQEHLPLMLNTSVIRFQPIKEKMRFSFVYEYLNSTEFLFKLVSMASGSVQKNFGPMHLKQIKLVCPPIDLLAHYESICRPLFEKLVANRARIQTLATLLDTLLPRLMSGKISLSKSQSPIANPKEFTEVL